jgi:tRNA(adenine34) deaminase
MWDDLSAPWQACLELAWEAYCDDCVPIGAVVTDPDGVILSRGRNRVYPREWWKSRPCGAEIAHAEVEALRSFDYSCGDHHTFILYTTTEPCPMCLGTLYMSGLRTCYYAARDAFGGSADLLGKTWYLSRKPVRVLGPQGSDFENLVTALSVEQDCSHDGLDVLEGEYYQRVRVVLGMAVDFGRKLWECGDLKNLRKSGATAEEMVNQLTFRLK